MLLKNFISSASNVFAENRLLKFVIVVLGLATIYNSYCLHEKSLNQRTVLITPNMVNNDLWVQGNEAGFESLKKSSYYVMGLMWTYNSGTIKAQYDTLKTLFHPEVYPQQAAALDEIVGKVEGLRTLTSSFVITGFEKGEGNITIRGVLRQYLDGVKVNGDKENKVFTLEYSIDNGQFWIRGIYEKKLAN